MTTRWVARRAANMMEKRRSFGGKVLDGGAKTVCTTTGLHETSVRHTHYSAEDLPAQKAGGLAAGPRTPRACAGSTRWQREIM